MAQWARKLKREFSLEGSWPDARAVYQEILETKSDPEKMLDQIIGYSEIGDPRMVKFYAHRLFEYIDCHPDEIPDDECEKVRVLREIGLTEEGNFLNRLGLSLAFYGHRELTMETVKRGVDQSALLYGATLGEQRDLIELFLTASTLESKCRSCEEKASSDSEAGDEANTKLESITGLSATNGKREQVMWLINKKGACRNLAVYWSAVGGRRDLVCELLQNGACLRAATLGAIKGKHLSLAAEMMSRQLHEKREKEVPERRGRRRR